MANPPSDQREINSVFNRTQSRDVGHRVVSIQSKDDSLKAKRAIHDGTTSRLPRSERDRSNIHGRLASLRLMEYVSW